MAHSAHHFLVYKLLTRKKSRRTVDSMAYLVGVLGNLAVIPQVIKAWQSNAPGLSILTWALFVAIGFVWLAYAIVHRQKPLIVAQSILLICDSAVVLGWLVNNWHR